MGLCQPPRGARSQGGRCPEALGRSHCHAAYFLDESGGPVNFDAQAAVSAPGRIIVGVDGSEDSERALEWAAALVEDSIGEIVAVHAMGLLTRLDDGLVVPSMGHRDHVVTLLEQRWCRPLIESSVAHRCMVVDGDPVTALLRTALEEDADLIVVGCRGAGGHAGLALGSTSQQIVFQADRPVVVVPQQAPRR